MLSYLGEDSLVARMHLLIIKFEVLHDCLGGLTGERHIMIEPLVTNLELELIP